MIVLLRFIIGIVFDLVLGEHILRLLLVNLLGYGFNLTDLVHGVSRLVNVRILYRYGVAYAFVLWWTAGRLWQLWLVFGQIGGRHHW